VKRKKKNIIGVWSDSNKYHPLYTVFKYWKAVTFPNLALQKTEQ
jgi:hypothetical protein